MTPEAADKITTELMALADNWALSAGDSAVSGDESLPTQCDTRAVLEQAIRRAVDWGEPHAWLTLGTLDGKRRLSMGEVTTNPEYKKMHKEWDWTPLYARKTP